MLRKVFLSLLIAFLCFVLAWPPYNFLNGLIFMAFVPLFYVVHLWNRSWYLFLLLIWLTFTGVNAMLIYWIIYSTFWGGIFTIAANALLMSLPLLAFYFSYKKWGASALWLFLLSWLAFEWFHFNWEVHFPWLTLGFVFSEQPSWVQWYEYTGVAGGSVWILLVNVLVFKIFLQKDTTRRFACILASSMAFVLPLLYSFGVSMFLEDVEASPDNVVIVQPNVDCYEEKFVFPMQQQLAQLIRLSEACIDTQTRFVLWPETALPDELCENPQAGAYHIGLTLEKDLGLLLRWLKKHPQLCLVSGMSTFRIRRSEEKKDPSVRYFLMKRDTLFYSSHNSMMALSADAPAVQFYHKSRLVPGVEQVPYVSYLGFMNRFLVNLGGVSGTLGADSVAHNFYYRQYQVAPLICYESIYGDYVSDFVRKGAQMLFLVTNDGWWRDTKGYKQHAAYGRLRAIEFRKYIYRSANTGISYVADLRGKCIKSLDWDEEDAFKYPVYSNEKITFYARHPDLVYAMGSSAYAGLLLFFFWRYRGRSALKE